MEYLLSIISAVLGYLSLNVLSTPGSKINRRLPEIKIKKVQIMPSVKILIRGRIIHLHHWFQFTVVLVISIFVSNSFLDSITTRSFLVGGILQGLKFADRSIFSKK